MAYFPFFVDLEDKPGLIAGGGRTALGKAKRLVEYGPKLAVVAPKILPELAALPGVMAVRREFCESDLDGAPLFAVAATDSAALNREISRLCRKRHVPVNVVDAPEDCTFLFPALARRGPLSVGISTSGTSPAAAVHFKERIDALLPERLEEILEFMQAQRAPVKQRIESEAVRKAIFESLFAESLRLGRPLTAEETEQIIKEARE